MYLKSIDIFGYKSFATKTHLDLEFGITGVIGPNGCGKSNIMESVRWCLGEMSWKSLRASAMTEVIFSGTARRAPMSMTEVTLTFDNASQMLPVQFSEVTVTRRIFRSGESAYFLNKTQCRLRDIRELFLDTGIGNDGYAIIDQGGVDAMISSKPEERRAFFEEAAGVAKYNSKREEALRKLERVSMDMGRLQDSISLINEQVKKLDNDARKAKLFQKYKEELAALEAAHVLQEIGRLQAELAALSSETGPLEETLGQKRTEMNAEGAQHAAHNLERANQQNQALDCNQRISDLKSEIGRLEERIRSAESSVAAADARRAACDAELAAMGERLGTVSPEIERASGQVAEAEAGRAAAQAELDGWSAQFEALCARLSEAEQAQQAARSASLSAAESALGMRRQLSESESAWTRLEMQCRASLRELEKDLAQLEKGRGEIEAVRGLKDEQTAKVEGARTKYESDEMKVTDLRKRLEDIGEGSARLRAELASTKARAEALEVQGGQNPYWVGAQTVLAAGIPGVVGTVRQLFEADENAKPFLEDLLGERLYAVVCEDSTAARAAVGLLASSGQGRARLLVLSALPAPVSERALPEAARSLLRQVRFEPKHEPAVRFLLQEAYELDKMLFGEHWVYGGAPARESLQLNLAGVDQVRADAASCETKIAELAGEKERAVCELAAAESAAREARAALSSESNRAHAIDAQLAEKEAGLSSYTENAELSTSEAARALAEMALKREDIRELRARIGAADSAESEARRREADSAAALQRCKDERLSGQATQSLLESKLQGIVDKISFLAGAYERLVEEKDQLEENMTRRRDEILELGRQRGLSLDLSAQSKEALQTLGSKLAELENAARAVFERLAELDRAIAEREASLRALKTICEEAQQRLHELEVRASAQRATQDSLKKRLWDDWQLTADEARAKYKDQIVDAERIDFLRKRVVALGAVNLAAPEEYAELTQKHDFLISQLNDLLKAEEDLRAAISKINGATRENFRQTFTEVREHFRRLYGVLFEGGEADLILTDPENMLETGVDIVAQPPGKRLQSISLLSGGEKALTAIALLFAFFMVKPSPFCMLDEADAALDDANVERFVSILREFQDKTQFLIVSHNKRTMEAADVIYGVTMEEMGVSQLISVDFRKKEGPAAELPRRRPMQQGPFAPRTRDAAPSGGGASVAVLEDSPSVSSGSPQDLAVSVIDDSPSLVAEANPAAMGIPVIEPIREDIVEPEIVPEPIAETSIAESTPEPEPVVEMAAEPVADAPSEPLAPSAETDMQAPSESVAESQRPPDGTAS